MANQHQDLEHNVGWQPSNEGDDPSPLHADDGGIETHHADDAARRSPMQRLLGHYCGTLENELMPILDPLRRATEVVESTGEVPAQAVLPGLRELRGQLEQLVSKVAEQQAYVSIFGPLKSGKSTLMNAICAKYVSEVTSLPAYPCLVQVSHASDMKYEVIQYDGDTANYTEEPELRRALEDSHRELVDTIRRVESSGEEFEPHRHAPQAIARIDVHAPAGDLEQSGAVLVDTPGLYSRMKFGYDRMTRDFRDAAACAIFVVKTDNLFLDQVFDEFEELLELFSRIFLIVNLDAGKRDLQPDGSLRPSVEHENPQAVVRAFENLSMSATVKAAREDGRLRIYPVDLLGAASRRIRGVSAQADIEDTPHGQADFDRLLEDLTDYLNSNDYLRAFVGDSLRRAETLVGDLLRLLDDRTFKHLEGRVTQLTNEEKELGGRKEAIERLRKTDWAGQLDQRRQAVVEAVQKRLEPIKRKSVETLDKALDRWFESEASLQSLLTNDVEPALSRCREECVKLVREELEGQLVRPVIGGEAFAADIKRDFATTSVEADKLAQAALGELSVADHLTVAPPSIDSRAIPVKRELLDWLLLRGVFRVRERLFGPAEEPDRTISPEVKAQKLGEQGREAIRAQLHSALTPFAEQAAQQLPKAATQAYEAYLAAWKKQLSPALDEVSAKTQKRLESVAALREDARGVLDALLALEAIAAPALEASSTLNERFAAEDIPSAESGEDSSLNTGEDEAPAAAAQS